LKVYFHKWRGKKNGIHAKHGTGFSYSCRTPGPWVPICIGTNNPIPNYCGKSISWSLKTCFHFSFHRTFLFFVPFPDGTTFFLSATQKESKKVTVWKKSLEFYAWFSPCETKTRFFRLHFAILLRIKSCIGISSIIVQPLKQGFANSIHTRKPRLNFYVIFFRRQIKPSPE